MKGLKKMNNFCLRGHELTEENCYVAPKTGSRNCRVCQRLRRRGYDKTEKYIELRKIRFNKSPWLLHYHAAKKRALRKNGRYYKRGLVFELTKQFVKKIWFRDKADKLEKPSLDRYYGNIGYTKENVRFIEWEENKKRKRIVKEVCYQ